MSGNEEGSDPMQLFTQLQSDFHSQFMSGKSRFHELVAPPGMGKTRMAVGVVASMMGQREARVLCLVPRMRANWIDVLRKTLDHDLVLGLDAESFRERLDQAGPSGCPFPARVVVVTNPHFAGRAQVAEAILKLTWDLLVVDEIHAAGAGALTFIRDLVSTGRVGRLLLLSSIRKAAALANDIVVTDWGHAYERAMKAFPSPAKQVPYSLSAPEQRYVSSLRTLADHLMPESSAAILGVFRNRVESSLYALDATLRRMRNAMVHEGIFVGASLAQEDDLDLSGRIWRDPGATLPLLNVLLEQFDELENDSKLATLRQLLGVTPDADRTVICTRYAETATYLASALEPNRPVLSVTSSRPMPERERAVGAFDRHGGILIVTDASMQGLDFRNASQLIHFDAPGPYARAYLRISHVAGARKAPAVTELVPSFDLPI